MKKLIGIAALVLMMTGGVFAKNPGLELSVKEKQVLVVELDQVEAGSFLLLEDVAGEILFKNDLTNGNYETSLDFKVIPVGTYFLTFENDRYIRTSVIEKTRSGLEVKKQPEVAFKPCFKVENNSVLVFLTNPGEKSTSLTILDAEGRVVGKAKDQEYIFTRTLDFSAMPAGEYTITLRTGKHSFKHKVNLG